MNYELFAIYGIMLEYPEDWDIHVGRKLERFEGAVTFRSPGGLAMVVSWGLPATSDDETEPSLQDGLAESIDKLRRISQVKAVRKLEDIAIQMNGHKGLGARVEVDMHILGGFFRGKLVTHKTRFAYSYCKQTERYFAIYGTPVEKLEDIEGPLEHLVGTLKCHK